MSGRSRSEARVRELLDRVDWNFIDYNPSERAPEVHGLHWYPAPFPPGLAGTLIEVLGNGGTYLDPFSGSGVGPIEAWLRGYRAIGVDINPVATRIGRAKVALLTSGNARRGELLAEEYAQFRASRLRDYLGLTSEDICEMAVFERDAERWFEPKTLAELATIKEWMTNGIGAQEWREVILVLVSSILHRRLSELRHVHYTYIVDRSRTKSPPRQPVDAYLEFSKKLKNTFIRFEVTRDRLERAGIISAAVGRRPLFVTGNSGECIPDVAPEADLVVTSPPYFGMNDYVRSQYLTWLIFPWDSFSRDVSLEMGPRRERRSAFKLDNYLGSLGACFKAVGQKMATGGYMAVIMGTSRASETSVRASMDDLSEALSMTELRLFWRGVRRVVYRKINNTPYREEHIWVMRKGD